MAVNRNNGELEARLWDAADSLRANSKLKSHEYSVPVLGIIYLRFAESRFLAVEEKLNKERNKQDTGRVVALTPADFQAEGAMFIPEQARYSYLLNLPESVDIGKKINEAMKLIEEYNTSLVGVLPKTYTRLENHILVELFKSFASIPFGEGDVFGKIYEYFLGHFAMTEGQKGGEFFTPTSIVKLIVEIIEPFSGRVFDPACGSGGMFVQSANFVKEHKANPSTDITVYGQEKVEETLRLCKMNLAVHGLEGEIKQGNSFYEDLHESVGAFDFVMANPPFNVKGVDMEKIKDDPRFKQGVPSTDNGNYLWIEMFYSALNEKGRAGFVMANSASDARNGEMEIRKKIIEEGAVDVMISVSSNFFYTVTLPVTLWFFDKGKRQGDRKNKVLFIDARNTFRQIDRAHRDFSEEQIEQLAGIVKSYRGEKGTEPYEDIKGLCKVASLEEIRAQDYSLNPGRYIGVADKADDGFDFKEKFSGLHTELMALNAESKKLEAVIDANAKELLSVN